MRTLAFSAVALLLAAPTAAHAQSLDKKAEVGGQVTVVTANPEGGSVGLGGRVGYNINDNFALEGEVNAFPDASAVEGLFGLKAGVRSDRAGIFAKVRPGFLATSG